MVEYKKKLMKTKNGKRKYYYLKLTGGKSKRISKTEYISKGGTSPMPMKLFRHAIEITSVGDDIKDLEKLKKKLKKERRELNMPQKVRLKELKEEFAYLKKMVFSKEEREKELKILLEKKKQKNPGSP